ncbi:MAG: hypothetical protein Q4B54_00765 [Coriobacteriales bacterium]|nr:hypothetical protein [Coriobacteriales bacterium]
MGDAFNLLAEGREVNVLLVLQNADGEVSSYEFSDDSVQVLIDEARTTVRKSRDAVRYALTYEAGVEVEDGSYADALILEFGEKGCASFSAYSFFEGRGAGDDFRWTDPAPAGEEEPLLG